MNSSTGFPSPHPQPSRFATTASPLDAPLPNFRPSSLLIPSHNGPTSLTKPIPPPASLPRKQDPSTANQRVVHPPKDSCYKSVPFAFCALIAVVDLSSSLPIMFPSIPEGGTKSRVETQVRVTVDLADASSSSDPFKYDRVGSWKWLKLPQGTATKKRTRKQGKIGKSTRIGAQNTTKLPSDPEPQDILHLSASVTCASPPHNRVLSCSSCQRREVRITTFPIIVPLNHIPSG